MRTRGPGELCFGPNPLHSLAFVSPLGDLFKPPITILAVSQIVGDTH
jgi:hypothetical protein